MNQLIEIAQIANTYPDGKIIFDEPVQVKASPHIHVFTAFAIWSGPEGVYVMDGAGEWHGPLNEQQANAGFVISSLYQRLKAIVRCTSAVVASYDKEVNAVIFE